jgi:hypothetical protein
MLKSTLFKGGSKELSASSSQLDLNHKTFNNSSNPLVVWYDFTDVTTMDRDQSGTAITASGHPIGRIRNKANPQPGATYKIATHLDQVISGSKPTWTSNGTIAGSYGQFDGSDDFLVADKDTGNVDTNKLSDTTLNGSALTAFWVAKADFATVSVSESVFSIMDAVQSYVLAGVRSSDDEWIWNTLDNVARTNTVIDSGVDPNTALQAWMVKLKGGIGGNASQMYTNGIKTGLSNGDGDDYDYTLSADDADNCIMIGATAAPNATPTTNTYWDGNISEIIVFDGGLAPNQYVHIMNYLTKKYNITRLS